jgi:hypothetical protein
VIDASIPDDYQIAIPGSDVRLIRPEKDFGTCVSNYFTLKNTVEVDGEAVEKVRARFYWYAVETEPSNPTEPLRNVAERSEMDGQGFASLYTGQAGDQIQIPEGDKEFSWSYVQKIQKGEDPSVQTLKPQGLVFAIDYYLLCKCDDHVKTALARAHLKNFTIKVTKAGNK